LTYLPERKMAFDNLNARTNMASIRGVVNTLVQAARFGTPLAQSLRVLAAEFREARITRAEEKAARLPALLTVPMIIFILPTLFIVLLGPAMLGVVDAFGHNGPRAPTTVERTDDGGPEAGDGDVNIIDRARIAKTGGVQGGQAAAAAASVIPLQQTIASGRLLLVDVDARPLHAGSRRYVVLVPAGSADALDPPDSIAVEPVSTRISLSPHAVGPAEIRLYYLPPDAASPVVAARAAITVTPAGRE
jgi:hypothetical protein